MFAIHSESKISFISKLKIKECMQNVRIVYSLVNLKIEIKNKFNLLLNT